MNYLPTPKLSKFWSQFAIACSISCSGLWFNGCAIALTANPENPTNVPQNQLTTQLALKFRLPSRGAPGPRDSAASRGEEHIIALIPGTNFGYTTEENPSLWVYFSHSTQEKVRLTLKNGEDEQVYQQELILSGTPGIVEISLPETFELEVDQVYYWEFEVGESYGDADNPIIRGAIERVVMDDALKSQLAGKSEQEKLEIYADNSLWFDVLSGLISLRQSNLEDEEIANLWTSLLQQIEFEELKYKPLLSVSDE